MAVICKKCKKSGKVDKHEIDEAVCGLCGGELDKESARDLNMMFTTQVGPVKESSTESYLRPETAQLIFANFKNVAENNRMKLPFGIAQIGKAFRNEIAPRDFLFRSREFEQMEIEYFIMPGSECPYKLQDMKVLIFSDEMQSKKKSPTEMKIRDALKKGIIKKDWHAYWLSNCLLFYKNLGCDMKNFRLRQHAKTELAHYSSDCWDLEYKFPFGWKELTGIADRSTYDLSRHEEFSKKDLKVFIEGKGKVLPEVIAEPSFGVERAFLVVMFDAYNYDKKRDNIVLSLDPKIAPIKAGIFPIVKVDKKVVGIAREVYEMLKSEWNVLYDDGGAIGRRYARQDEAGTPFTITIDADSIKGKDITIRERDSTKQIRIKISELKDVFRKLVLGEISFDKAGKKV
jgi:glycyl-tRNA synthetase